MQVTANDNSKVLEVICRDGGSPELSPVQRTMAALSWEWALDLNPELQWCKPYMLVSFYQLGFIQNYISNQNASQTSILAVSLDIGVPWRDGCGTFGDMSAVLYSSLFCNVMDYCISLARSLGALEIRLVKKEVEGPRELSDEEQTSFYVL